MDSFHIFSRKPFLVFRVGNNVYKFFDQCSNESEYDWVHNKHLLDEYNLLHEKKIEIPKIERGQYFIKSKYLGESVINYPSEITSLYHSITSFSTFHQNSPLTTISIGDAQLRNAYISANGFYFLDLGVNFGKIVSIYYDRSRFLVHLVDSNYRKIARDLLCSDPQKDILLVHIRQRANYVFYKRLKSAAVFSSVYRYLNFLVWQMLL